jgi:hypothetical protein
VPILGEQLDKAITINTVITTNFFILLFFDYT